MSCELKVPVEAPNPNVTGSSITEKLRDIYIKNELFQLHLSQVETYMQNLTIDQQLFKCLKGSKDTLRFLLGTIKKHIENLDPSTPVPTPPAPLKPTPKKDYAKIRYGCGVIVGLLNWERKVKEVMEEKQNWRCLQNSTLGS